MENPKFNYVKETFLLKIFRPILVNMFIPVYIYSFDK